MIGIGIDTGGTCTDAVIIDTTDHRVLSYGKTLTTKNDLKEGILKALSELDQELVKKARYLSLSTTLATNACVEGKGGRAKLVFFGVKKALVEKMRGTYGLPDPSEICFLSGDAGRDESEENRPDWKAFRREVRESFADFDSVALVQINPKYNDGAYEKKGEEIVREELGIPCVRGYDLYQEVNVQKRGATALLNARLLSVMNDFFDSIDRSLAELGLELPVQVVKSDGTIMSRDYAVKRPVETLLCGPAASIIGAMELSDRKNAMVVDMGGTTSDVAMVRNGVPVTSDSGISIGPWKTMVKGVTIDTFALGGDSAVEYEDNRIYLEKRRVVPLCMAASRYPQVEEKLRALVSTYAIFSYPANQFFMLQNVPENMERFTANERKLISALQEGPLLYEEAAQSVGISPYVFRCSRLEDEGVVIRCGVTPTDVMHVQGDFTDYCTEASRLGIEYLRMVTKKPFDVLCSQIYDMAKNRLYSNLASIFLKYETGRELLESEREALKSMTQYLFRKERTGEEYRYLRPSLDAEIGFIGIGAPTRIFLQDVAELFHTDADFPKYAMVANAIGAAVGSVVSEYVVKIEPCGSKGGHGNFMITGGSKVETFEYYDDALKRARQVAEERAVQRARSQGAEGELKLSTEVHEDHYDMAGGADLFIETQVVCRAEAE